ncbi:MBL fold metallo-hydrolase [Massilia sp. P8910]|uniref:MBL fold metallo-hydrolase n=1 Tax=Massilia antarctica TaxID=2765360 RepID=UPI001E2EEA02|nr:MBL fold metallo-hydrolase [Massilia antarctica]MCE3602587.1 MBL fold metallo-hydrolase [Massilia antarctica]
MTSNTKLTWKHFPAGQNGFFRAPVLLQGPTEALLIDGGFTLSDGKAVADAIAAGGKPLKAVYVSQSDPDYYFSLGAVRSAFPEVPVLAAHATVAAIHANVQKKLDVWGPQLKANGPQTLAEVVLPAASDASTLSIDGESIEIVNAEGMSNRRYLWVPSLEAIFGGVLVFSGVHVWTADTATPELRAAWVKNLDAMAVRQPRIVVPGHGTVDAPADASAIAYTRGYLLAFEEEAAKAADSAALIAAMKQRYPDAGMEVALTTGAKVVLGEMKWG